MAVFVALLRAVNVGGTGMLPMAELRTLCVELGWRNVRTYIQSGNVVFESPLPERAVRAELERALAEKMGRHVGVLIRTAPELRTIFESNPFPNAAPAQVGVVFLSEPAPKDLLVGPVIPGQEELHVAGREIFVHYPGGMGRSRLKIPPPATEGTMRNLNTVAKLVTMTEV